MLERQQEEDQNVWDDTEASDEEAPVQQRTPLLGIRAQNGATVCAAEADGGESPVSTTAPMCDASVHMYG